MLQGKIIWLTPPLILQPPYYTPPCAKSRKRTCLLTSITSVFRLAVRRYVYIFPHHQLEPRALSILRSVHVARINASERASATGRSVSRTSTACTLIHELELLRRLHEHATVLAQGVDGVRDDITGGQVQGRERRWVFGGRVVAGAKEEGGEGDECA